MHPLCTTVRDSILKPVYRVSNFAVNFELWKGLNFTDRSQYAIADGCPYDLCLPPNRFSLNNGTPKTFQKQVYETFLQRIRGHRQQLEQ